MRMEAQIQMIPVTSLLPNSFQPRVEFDQESINTLADSIKTHGIITPLIVKRVQDKFEIISGERRLKAAQMIGLTAVPCIICEVDEKESAQVSIVEKLHSKDLTAIEEAKNYKKLLDKQYLTQEELCQRMGISTDLLISKINLLSLDEAVQTALQKGEISERHARSLLKLTDKMKQVDLLNEIIANRLTVKQVDERINQIINGYNAPQDLTGGINIDTKSDIDVSNTLLGNQDFNLSITPTQYQYTSKINEDESKKSLFFNNLENAPVTMDDPTLSFGFDPNKAQPIQTEEPEIIELDDDDDELPGFLKPNEEVSAEEARKKKFNVDIYTPREFTKAVNELIEIATENGLEIKTEEFNFNDVYQMVIKIVKETDEDNSEEDEEGDPISPENEIPTV